MLRHKLYSKNGCSRCRERRKKCDEVRPVCGSCRKINTHCSYSSDSSQAKVVTRLDAPPGRVTHEAGRLRVQDRHQITYFEPLPEYNADTYQVFQYYAENHSRLSLLPDGSPAISLLKLLPIACSDACSLLALSAVLTGYLPDSSKQKHLQASLTARAMSNIRIGLSSQRSDSLLNLAFLAACMLYLLQLHSITSTTQDRVHLHGMGAIIVEKIRINPSNQNPLATCPIWLQRMMAMFSYHLAVSSTIDHSLMDGGYLEQILDYCVKLIDSGQAPDMFEPTIMGIPTRAIPTLVGLARLRKEILAKDPTEATINSVLALQQAEIETYRSPLFESPLVLLFTQAWSIFRATLLKAVGLQLAYGDELALYDCMDGESTAALLRICSVDTPHHSATWPLFIIGLASCDLQQRDMIQSCLERMVVKSCLRSVRGVLETLTFAWQQNVGASILLLPQLGSSMTF